eukprot:CAMPEP_0197241082 /NCGR_PEP_ID=MMETSP1429-20130617/7208_1 /TAXON_ID=49237 /ORGANISM="Chaetoceros  sp., Strain UNC1202" /LENGTH=137 /DNA_ID=CAMNT_0042700849 /DNA_START=56 /DNA_END=469 /DNA_ORIENTATION=+
MKSEPQSPLYEDCKQNDGQQSPVCVSSPASIASTSSRPISPFADIQTAIPLLPISMDCRYTPPHAVQSYDPDAQTYELDPQEGTLMFEGKGFHYLDSSSLSFEESDDLDSCFDTKENNFDMTGLSVNLDGKLTGFDS